MSCYTFVAIFSTLALDGVMALEDVSNYTFDLYKKDFGRTYQEGDGEHEMRRSIFNERIAEIQAHNAEQLSWTMGVNDLTDRTQEELKMLRGHKSWMRAVSTGHAARSSAFLNVTDDGSGHEDGKACTAHEQVCANSVTPCCNGLVCGSKGHCEKVTDLPRTHDWTTILPTAKEVLNQGGCGSCWAVAATGALQMQAVINSELRFHKQLSAQNFLSCTPNPYECGGQGGCEGATAELAYQWLLQAGAGVHTLDQQEYRSYATKDNCPAYSNYDLSLYQTSFLQKRTAPRTAPQDAFGPGISITGWKKLKENSAEEMMKHLVTVGPLVGSVVGDGLYSYSRGIIPGCKSPVMDHAILMMGYGEDEGRNMRYWKVRNSWGSRWGENGFFRLQRFYPHKEEPCMMDYSTDKGVGCKDKMGPEGHYPASQRVCGACAILGDTTYPVGTKVPEPLL